MISVIVCFVVGMIVGASIHAVAYNEGMKSVMDNIEPRGGAEIIRPNKWGEYAKAKNKRTWLERRTTQTSHDAPY